MPALLQQFTMNLLGHFPSRLHPSGVVHTSLASASVSSELSVPGLKRAHFPPARVTGIGLILARSVLHDSSLCNRVRQAVRSHVTAISFPPSTRTEPKSIPPPPQHFPAITMNIARVGLFTSVSTNARLLASGIVPLSFAAAWSASGIIGPLREEALRAPPEVTTNHLDTTHLPKIHIEQGALQPVADTDTSHNTGLDDNVQPATDLADFAIAPSAPPTNPVDTTHSPEIHIERGTSQSGAEANTPDTIQSTTDVTDLAIVGPALTEDQQPPTELNIDPCASDILDTDATLGSTSPSITQEEPIEVEVATSTPDSPVSDSRPLTKSAIRRLRRQRAEARAAAAEGREPRNDHVVRKMRKCQRGAVTPLAEDPDTSTPPQLPTPKIDGPLIPATGPSDPTSLPSEQDLPTESTTKVPSPHITNWQSPIPPPKTVTAHDIEALAAQLSRLRCDDRPRARNVKQRR
ncbi:hypothetical protein F5I97DRAFT_15068 [Phlebopus sp. FC_14]|nr:hypothetical protein F5I97DRAFT_15068 [Phlebopus sp. FC_14]